MKKYLIIWSIFTGVMLYLNISALSLFLPFLFLPFIFAHCDTLDGPVVKTARAALEKKDLAPILKWIKKEDEAEIKDLFEKTLTVRTQGKEAKELADMHFLETLIRIHRAGEGEPYTGLKPAGVVEPAVTEADKSLETGSAENLVKVVTEAVSKGILERFARAKEAKKHADHNVDAGREFVEAYVQFTHYVERLHLDATTSIEHHADDSAKHHGH